MRWYSVVKPISFCLLLGLEFALVRPALAAEVPQYQIEPCCQICPQILEDSTYKGDLSEVRKLFQGQDDWLFRSRVDLMIPMGTTPQGYANLQQLRDTLKKKGVELLIVYIPARGIANARMLSSAERQGFDYELAKRNYLAVIERMRSLGILVPDLSPLLSGSGQEDKPLFFKRDHHWTPYGAEFTARLVVEEMRKYGALKSIPRKEFITHSAGLMNKVGSLNTAFQKICGYRYANQFVPRFITEQKDESTDLFGEADAPEVVLAGTSFSTQQYNFDGFLKQYANVDVDNRSLSGGGFQGAMLQYLDSQDFRDKPPKILIWEITSYHDLGLPLFYRQVMPIIADGCRSTPAAISHKVVLQPGKNEVLVNSDVKSIRSDNYIADIQFSNADVKELHGVLWYMNGTKETLSISRGRAAEADGRFVFRLRDDPEFAEQTLLSLEIDMPADLPSGLEVEAKVCQRADKSNAQLQAATD